MTGMDRLLQMALRVQKAFSGFVLAGGTSIMSKYNHRESIDLDFFNEKDFSANKLATKARKFFMVDNEERGTDNSDLFIEEIKVSFVYFPMNIASRS